MMKQAMAMFLVLLLMLSAVNVALADAPSFDAIGDQEYTEGNGFDFQHAVR